MSKASYPSVKLNSQITLRDLTQQVEDGVVIVGHGEDFLELPLEGVDFLEWLNEGFTLAQARARFEAKYNPFPDEELLELIELFLESDFVAAVDGRAVSRRKVVRYSNAPWFRQHWAMMLFSTPVLVIWMLFVTPAAALWVTTPELWPRRADYFWIDYNFLIVLVGVLLWLASMAIHELAHWVAARAKGIDATITWTQRLGFFPMSQTIMHNIWAVPRANRLIPIAAGMIWDIFGISVVLYILYFNLSGVVGLPVLMVRLLKFYLLTSTMALIAQFWLFSKMDGYFLLSTLFGQRNLQGDSFNWLKSNIARAGQFDPPRNGMRFIYLYVFITVFWGGLFMGQFLLVDLPIKLQLLWESMVKVWGGSQLASLNFADGVAVLTSQTIFWGLLAYAYWRDTVPNWRGVS
jgi:putative peptide zinc metalloprotease protein